MTSKPCSSTSLRQPEHTNFHSRLSIRSCLAGSHICLKDLKANVYMLFWIAIHYWRLVLQIPSFQTKKSLWVLTHHNQDTSKKKIKITVFQVKNTMGCLERFSGNKLKMQINLTGKARQFLASAFVNNSQCKLLMSCS